MTVRSDQRVAGYWSSGHPLPGAGSGSTVTDWRHTVARGSLWAPGLFSQWLHLQPPAANSGPRSDTMSSGKPWYHNIQVRRMSGGHPWEAVYHCEGRRLVMKWARCDQWQSGMGIAWSRPAVQALGAGLHGGFLLGPRMQDCGTCKMGLSAWQDIHLEVPHPGVVGDLELKPDE